MAQKLYDVVVKTGEYQGNDGQTKGRYENIGVMMQGDNGPYLLLKRHISPAGFPNPDNRDTVLCSLFSENNNQQQAPQQQNQNGFNQQPQQNNYQQQSQGGFQPQNNGFNQQG